MERKIWKLGIDPGFTMTGLVLCHGPKDPTAWALHRMEPGLLDNPNVRAQSLATGIINTTIKWIETYGITNLEIAIELPIWRFNAQTLILQTRLLQEVETGCMMLLPSLVPHVWLTEVNPTTSKRVLTGDPKATKSDMIECSPWARTWQDVVNNFDEAHTLADAYAHLQSAGERQYNLTSAKLYANTLVAEEPND